MRHDLGKMSWPGCYPSNPADNFRLQAGSPALGRGAYPKVEAVYFVSPEGNDSANGQSVSTAWKTLKRAVAGLTAGGTLYLLPGRWSEPLHLNDLAGSADAPITIRVRGTTSRSITAPCGTTTARA